MKKYILTKQEIENRIPHSGNMCLLDSVLEYNEKDLICETNTHQDIHNPLRSSNALTAINAIEYAGQAVALHRQLQAHENDKSNIKLGYLAALKEVEIFVADLSIFTSALTICVNCKYAEETKAAYNFKILHQQHELVKGSMIVAEGV